MNRQTILSASALLAASSAAMSAHASFDATMYGVGADLSTFTNLVATLDISSTSYDFPFDNSQYTTSGYVREVGGSVVDSTGLVTNVYQVTTQTTFNQGGDSITLNAGDMIWAYTIDLVSASSNTVSSLGEFQVGGLSFLGVDAMAGDLVLGRGYLDEGSGVNTPLGGNAGDLEDLGDLGSSLDWQWDSAISEQLFNEESITLLMFTSAAQIGEGLANFIAPPVQSPGVDPVANGAPVLIPIPAPGTAGLMLVAGALAARRRR